MQGARPDGPQAATRRQRRDPASGAARRATQAAAALSALPVVCLIGLRGAGKSTAGKALALRLGLPFVDLDRAVEGRAGQTIRELFALEGEAAFRELEAEALRDTVRLFAAGPGAVIATGGGVVEGERSRATLREAVSIYLRCPPAVLAARVEADPTHRPPLVEGGPLVEARALEARRDPLYRDAAAAVVAADQDLERVVAALVEVSGPALAAARSSRPPAP